jgi:hypothetical protein
VDMQRDGIGGRPIATRAGARRRSLGGQLERSVMQEERTCARVLPTNRCNRSAAEIEWVVEAAVAFDCTFIDRG